MKDFTKISGNRFNDVYLLLYNKGIIGKSKEKFIKSLGYETNGAYDWFYRIVNHKSDIPSEFLYNLTKKYNINIYFIFGLSDRPFLNEFENQKYFEVKKKVSDLYA